MMRKTPQEKKALKYRKERRTGSLHGYVKSYPKTKARISRAYRHEANVTLRRVGIESLKNADELADEQAITRERLQQSIQREPGAHFKAHPHMLKEWVKGRLDARVQLAGDRYFAEAYNPPVHRNRFKRYLQALMSGHSLRSARVAEFYKAILDPQDLETQKYHTRRREWLRLFFRDEPEYQLRLNAWIKEMERQFAAR
ncbi:MAG TPA: hypothetical protein VLB68_10325 [Pyrinomonadaceae bacterium]|nr:hypothetical protein [Pyrinomonadaceae bacterium]